VDALADAVEARGANARAVFAVVLLEALRDAGYDLGDGFPADGDALIGELIAAGGYDTEWLTDSQLAAAPMRVPAASYLDWFGDLPATLASSVREHRGEPPGSLYTDGGDIVLAGLRFGNVAVMIQPPRGFGENPVAIYHDPPLNEPALLAATDIGYRRMCAMIWLLAKRQSQTTCRQLRRPGRGPSMQLFTGA